MRLIRTYILILVAGVLASSSAYAQTKEQIDLARDLAKEGLEYAEAGQFEEALKQFRYAQRLTPDDIKLTILIGQTLFRQELYEEVVIEILPLIETKNANDRCYQLIGNAFDMMGRPDDAVKMYKKGLFRFERSPVLYMELGILEYARGRDSIAREWWEKGIEMDPTAAANYYWAAKAYSRSRQPIRAIIYSEIYINMDRASERTREMSRLLYSTLMNCISVDSNGAPTFEFSKDVSHNYSLLNQKKARKMTFEEAYTFCWYLAFLEPVDSLDLHSLMAKREKFARIWDQTFGKKRKVQMFEWQRYLAGQGYFEPYHYWLFYDGDPAAYKTWYDQNKDVYLDFNAWFRNHPMPLEIDGVHGPALFRAK